MDEIKLEDHERQRCEIWSRVMGYHRPTCSWNVGKQGEWAERKFFTEKTSSRLLTDDEPTAKAA